MNQPEGLMSFQGQASGTVSGFHRVIFPNGQVASVGQDGFFESIVVFSEQEISGYDLQSEEGLDRFDWDLCVRATGSAQIVHRTVVKIGSVSDGRVYFQLKDYFLDG